MLIHAQRGLMMKRGWLISGLMLVVLMMPVVPANPQHGTVLVSFLPYLELAQNVAGGRLNVRLLLTPGFSPHTFDPTPRDLVTVREMGLGIINGYGIDGWIERLARASGSTARIVKLAEILEFERIRSDGGVDPHVWLDAFVMAKAATEVGEAFSRFDPSNAAFYRRNAVVERARLNALHAELRRTLEPVRGAGLVTFHNAWAYFARAYGLRVLAAIEPWPGQEPSASHYAQIVRTIRASGAVAVFSEPQLPERAARAIAQEASVPLYTLDPEGSGLAKDYTSMMRYNRDTLLKAFGKP
jgi:zinc transport system substrate-binding protein/manganese/iron transport system substrate-binding protein